MGPSQAGVQFQRTLELPPSLAAVPVVPKTNCTKGCMRFSVPLVDLDCLLRNQARFGEGVCRIAARERLREPQLCQRSARSGKSGIAASCFFEPLNRADRVASIEIAAVPICFCGLRVGLIRPWLRFVREKLGRHGARYAGCDALLQLQP